MTTDTTNEQTLFEGNPALVPNVWALIVSIFTVGLALLYFLIQAKQTHYKITTQRVIIETGLFSKRMDQIDIYRISDYVVERPLGQRIMGTGNIVLSSIDRSTPEVRLEGMKTDVMVLYEALRRATEEQKSRRGVRTLDATDHVT